MIGQQPQTVRPHAFVPRMFCCQLRRTTRRLLWSDCAAGAFDQSAQRGEAQCKGCPCFHIAALKLLSGRPEMLCLIAQSIVVPRQLIALPSTDAAGEMNAVHDYI